MSTPAQRAEDRVVEALQREVRTLDRIEYRAVLEGVKDYAATALDALEREEEADEDARIQAERPDVEEDDCG